LTIKTTYKNFYNESISQETFNEIRQLEKEGIPRHKIADRFNCCLSVIDNICNLGRQDLVDEKEIRKRKIKKEFNKKIRNKILDKKIRKVAKFVLKNFKKTESEKPAHENKNVVVENETGREFRIQTKTDKYRRFKEKGAFEQ